MASKPTFRAERPERRPTHPGVVLRDTVPHAIGMNVAPSAEAMGVSRQTLHRILSGRGPVTPAMALRIGKFCGNGPDVWLALQQAVDLWDARQAIPKELAAIPTQKAA